ncbi:hypothetical protein [Prochlorococcus sp. MIT 0604]|uniref:hypothetical protein n=1 Tax=Prochlorococcus sp. MIT 0604 TaxID=1501268 RepID=UPI0005B55905|nr:hypothetical protein [Prochlorococcus sp. MIT 0604]
MFVDSVKVTYICSKKPPVITTRKETRKIGQQKRELGLLILNRLSNNSQLLINGGASIKRFILFKFFLPKFKV